MARRVLEECAIDEGLGENGLDALLVPCTSGKVLEECEHFSEVHAEDRRLVLNQQDRAYVDVEVLEPAAFLRQICVPESQDARQRELAEQETVHPAEGELHEEDALLRDVGVQLVVDAVDEVLEPHDHPLEPRLRACVVVLYVVEQFGEAPVGVRLDALKDIFRRFEGDDVAAEGVGDEGGHAHEQDGREEVVDALHVAGGGVADGPDVQDALHDALDGRLLEERRVGRGARQVDLDLAHRLALVRGAVSET